MRISDWSSDVCSSDLPVRSAHFIDGAGAVEQLRAFQRAFDTAVFGGLARSARFRLGEIAIVRRTIAARKRDQRQQCPPEFLHPLPFNCDRSRTAPLAALVVIAA